VASAVIFDMDDTLVAFDIVSEKTWLEVCSAFAAVMAPSVSAETLYRAIREESGRFWGDPERHRIGRLDIEEARRRIVRAAVDSLGIRDTKTAVALADESSARRLANMHILPGAEEVLQTLASRGYRLALLTNGDSRIQRWKIKRFGLERYFPFIFIEEEQGFGKPDERAFLAALAALGVPARDAVMVGDNYAWEMEPALRLGITTVWHNYRGMRSRPEGSPEPDYTIGDIAELLGVLEKLA